MKTQREAKEAQNQLATQVKGLKNEIKKLED